MIDPRYEYRWTPGSVEVRGGGARPRIGGYAAMFNRLSRDLGGFVEQVMPNAFNQVRGRDWQGVMARYNHDDNMLLGTTHAGTLTLALDSGGLDYDVDPPDTRADVVELVQRGDVRGSSFAFYVHKDGDTWGLTEQRYPLRSLRSLGLVDVAPVNMPAYPDTTAALRSLATFKDADVADVYALAEARELRRLFMRTDGPVVPPRGVPVLGRIDPAAALVALAARRYDPMEAVA